MALINATGSDLEEEQKELKPGNNGASLGALRLNGLQLLKRQRRQRGRNVELSNTVANLQ